MAETGHARNLEHFETMIAYLTGYGAAYAPSNPDLDIASLTGVRDDAANAIADVAAKLAPWKVKIADRENIYSGIRKLSTRLTNSYAATGTEDNKVDNVKTINRDIQGKRAKALPPDDPDTPEIESEGNSVSHQSYVQVAESFSKMIEQLDEDPLYNPAENELKIATLTTLLNNMQTANGAVTTATVPLSNARINRNEAMYNEDTGLCSRAALVKKYVKSLFGADSPQYQQISALEFTPPRTH